MTLRAAAVFLVTMAAACAAPVPTTSNTAPPSPTAGPSPTVTPRPSPTPSPPPAFHIDGLATVTVDGLERWADPANKKTDASTNRKYAVLAAGTRVLLVDGPRDVDGIAYWQVYPPSEFFALKAQPLGWMAVADPDGSSNLTPFQPQCPAAEGITAEQLAALGDAQALSCFGNQELALHGNVHCDFGIADGYLAGPILSSTIFCRLDGYLGIVGHGITDLVDTTVGNPGLDGMYEIRGHFDDPDAQHCYQTPFGTSLEGSQDPGDPAAIQECRTFFVVTSAVES